MLGARRVPVVLLVVALAAVAGSVRVESASAFHTANPVMDTARWSEFRGLLRSTPSATVGTSPSTSAAVYRAQVAARVMPKLTLPVAGPLVLGATALVVGWKIGRIVDTQWLHIETRIAGGSSSGSTTCTTGGFSTLRLLRQAPFSSEAQFPFANQTGWVYYFNGTCNAVNVSNQTSAVTQDPANPTCGAAATADGVARRAWLIAKQAANPGMTLGEAIYGNGCRETLLRISAAAMTASAEINANRAWTAADVPSAGFTTTGFDETDDPGSTSTEADEARAAIMADPVAAEHFGEELEPGFAHGADADPDAINLPQPRRAETGAQYRARLRSLGFLGTIILYENDAGQAASQPQFGPSAVTGVNVGTPTLPGIAYPMEDPWPDPVPQIEVPGDEIEIEILHQPATAPEPAPGEPGSAADPPPGTAPPPGSPGGVGGGIGPGDCECPPPDFTPITSLDYGEKFPFGIVVLVVDTLDGFTATADAPVFSFDFDWIGIAPDYVVDLEVMDDYMSLIRSILSWVIWIGGVWWFGSRLLGFQGTGDVGAAIDDV